MPNFNQVILIGHLTRDIETRTTQGGTVVGNFGIAVNDKNGEREEVLFIDCTAFGKTAETMAKYLAKGRAVMLIGRLRLEQWEDKEGNKRSKHTVTVDRFTFIDSKGQDAPSEKRAPASRKQAAPSFADVKSAVSDEDIPF